MERTHESRRRRKTGGHGEDILEKMEEETKYKYIM
jgi:hypothetical protein